MLRRIATIAAIMLFVACTAAGYQAYRVGPKMSSASKLKSSEQTQSLLK